MEDVALDGFEVFEPPRRGSRRRGLSVTLQQSGNFSLGQSEFEVLGCPERVALLYNRATQQAALRVASADQPGTRVRCGGANYLVAATAFCRTYDIDFSVTRSYPAQINGSHLLIDLERGQDTSRPRGAKDGHTTNLAEPPQ